MKKNRSKHLHPAWEPARNILAGIKQTFRIAIAGQILLGQELYNHKKDLGFTHGGNRRSSGQFVHLKNRTWKEWVEAELGISYKQADRMIQMADAAKARIKKLGAKGDLIGGTKKLSLILDTRPSTLSAEDQERLSKVVQSVTGGATQAELLEELRIVKRHSNPPANKSSGSKAQKDDEQLAFNFWIGGGSQINDLRHHGSQFLGMIPVESTDPDKPSLRTLREETAALLEDIDCALKANLKPTKGKAS